MTTHPSDIIDLLAGIAPGSTLDGLRARRGEARRNTQESYRALFESPDSEAITATERFALATFVTGLHQQTEISDFYATSLKRLGGHDIAQAIAGEVKRGVTRGPYGSYPEGPISAENEAGQSFTVSPTGRTILGARLSVALEHAHLLVFHPRDASPQALDDLLASGWNTTGIVTLSQLVAFLAFQIRIVVGLRALSDASPVSKPVETQFEFATAIASGKL